jgi:hypothetical protein
VEMLVPEPPPGPGTPGCSQTLSGILELLSDEISELLVGSWYLEARLLGPYGPVNLPSPIFGGHILPSDTDADGVPDFRDACGNTPAGSLVNSEGCTIQQLCPCAGPWRNHGDYVNCIQRAIGSFVREALITPATTRTLLRDAANSDCGRR